MSLKLPAPCPFRAIALWLGLAAAFPWTALPAEETNLWPVSVSKTGPAGNRESWSALGPFLFDYVNRPGAPIPDAAARKAVGQQPAQPGDVISGFRPFYVQRRTPAGVMAEATVLYPIFYYRSYGDSHLWSVFNIINLYGRNPGADPGATADDQTFDIWPFYFSRDAHDPSSSYKGLFPIAGEMQGHLSYAKLEWVLFPLWVRTEKSGATTTQTPWPIVRRTVGAEQGFAVWPLFGRKVRPGVFSREYFLWPLTWNNTIQPPEEKPPGTPPKRQVGVLPFYSADTGPDSVSRNFLWPFFGYTDRKAPDRYHETRYFYPLLVQGHGDAVTVDRVGPFYTHSIHKGVDKTWVLWPLWRRIALNDDGLDQTKTQFLYFLYWDLLQRSASNPAAATARKTFVWPLFSYWNNGAGSRQFQALGLFDVFFPDNENVRESWAPLAAVVRHAEAPDGGSRTSLLWNAVTWERHPAAGTSSFHLGPLLAISHGPGVSRVSIGGGLAGLERGAAAGWRLFSMEFSGSRGNIASSKR